MKIKVCGLVDSDNITKLARCEPDYIGFIFYKRSPRYAGNDLNKQTLHIISDMINKVGVFVNESFTLMDRLSKHYQLDYIQLHGIEPPDIAARLKKEGFGIIKAFNIDESFSFTDLEAYTSCCDYFLFDAVAGKQIGGTGLKFNWSILGKYKYDIPFFLSGGIGPEDSKIIKGLSLSKLYGVDINSKFEIRPGIKDIGLVSKFFTEIRTNGG